MNPEKPEPEELDLPEFWRALQDLEDGSIDAGRRDELMDLLKRSAAARSSYFEYFQQSAIFEAEGAKMDEVGRLPIIGESGASRQLFHRALVVAAVVTVLLAVVATLIVIEKPPPETLRAEVAAETRWFVDEVWQKSGEAANEVAEGSTVRVSSGVLELTLPSGSTMVVQGPARVFFPELTRPVLEAGWLWIDSGEIEEDLLVEAGELLIRDIGTRFGVRVPEDGEVEIHLIEGEIEVSGKEGRRDSLALASAGQAVSLDRSLGVTRIPLAQDPFPGLPELLAARGNARTTLLSQAPEGYWKFEDERAGPLENEISGGGAAEHGVAVRLGEPGVGSQGDFPGYPESNRAIFLSGDPQKSAIVGLTGSEGVLRREGAVSFWIRSQANPASEQVLWLAGQSLGEQKQPEESLLHTRLSRDGRIVFFVKNDGDDVELWSARRVADGNWHHIVASWGASSVDLFIDGMLVAQDREERDFRNDALTGRFVRFGKPGLDLSRRGFLPFKGWVDEIAMWNRPLTHPEVLHQYQSAQGSARE